MDYTLLMEILLDFEKPIYDLESQIKKLEKQNLDKDLGTESEIKILKEKAQTLLSKTFEQLTSWQKVQLARHPMRPHSLEYMNHLFDFYEEIHGDRRFSEDASILCGFAKRGNQKWAYIAIEKGRKTADKVKHNFGMVRPEGYRKSLRLMELAEKFSLPILTLVDTPGAYPGIGAEERGQALAIAENIQTMFKVKTPIISVVIGEGGSGGALGIAVADKVFMQQHAIYSVISPESCASILWSDPAKGEEAAESLKIDAQMAQKLKVIDGIIAEPIGGAHRNLEEAVNLLGKSIDKALVEIKKVKLEELLSQRREKFRLMGNDFMVARK